MIQIQFVISNSICYFVNNFPFNAFLQVPYSFYICNSHLHSSDLFWKTVFPSFPFYVLNIANWFLLLIDLIKLDFTRGKLTDLHMILLTNFHSCLPFSEFTLVLIAFSASSLQVDNLILMIAISHGIKFFIFKFRFVVSNF